MSQHKELIIILLWLMAWIDQLFFKCSFCGKQEQRNLESKVGHLMYLL